MTFGPPQGWGLVASGAYHVIRGLVPTLTSGEWRGFRGWVQGLMANDVIILGSVTKLP